MGMERILVVDDELIVAKDIQTKLVKFGYDVPACASSGEKALKMTERMQPKPDLVVMDIKLGGNKDGVETAQQLRDRFNIPVVYVTAYTDEKILEQAMRTEPLGYLVKPFEVRELYSTVKMAMYRQRMEKQLTDKEERFATTLKSIADAVITVDIKGLITFMNLVAEGLTGWQEKEALGRRLTEVFHIVDKETRESVSEPLTESMKKKEVGGLEEPVILLARDGTEKVIDDSAAPIIDDANNITGAVLIFREIRVDEKADNRLVLTQTDGRFPGFGGMIGQSDIMHNMFERIQQIAKTDANVLIFGETGSGKELVAHAIHSYSLRKGADFVPVDCAAIPTDLLESELFGFEKGAFTGAASRKFGLLEFAHKGTLFLDEILGLDSNLQVKLLRVLQERCFRRIGGTKLIDIDMRVVGAMNMNPEEAVREGRLREDLYYRLNVIPIKVPPLRERRDDLPILANYFLNNICIKNRLEAKEITFEAMEFLINYPWPGNVRELENIMQRLVLLISGSVINVEDLPAFIKSENKEGSDLIFDKPFSEVKKHDLELLEKRYFSRLLKYTNYNIAKAARLARVSTRTIYRVLDRYGKL